MKRSIMVLGQPDSGKSNYLARLWESLRSGTGELELIDAPEIGYLEEMLAHLLQGEFAPRSDKSIEASEQDITLVARHKGRNEEVEIIVPDVTGELWRDAVTNADLPAEWMKRLESSSGALLFLRAHSEENHQPLDWVTSRRLLKHTGANQAASRIPTQVLYSELLRFLQLKLERIGSDKPKVAVVISAWDKLDPEQRAASPISYLKREFPLLAGRITNIDALNVQVFGSSVVGGDLEDDPAFKKRFDQGELKNFGYVARPDGNGGSTIKSDMTLPVSWLIE